MQPLLLNAIDKVFHILDQFTNEKPGVGVAFPAILLPKSRVPWVVKAVIEAAHALSLKLGYQEPKLGMTSKPATRRLKTPAD